MYPSALALRDAVQYIGVACLTFFLIFLLQPVPEWTTLDFVIRWYEIFMVNLIALITVYDSEKVCAQKTSDP